jgi:hypothetical protein
MLTTALNKLVLVRIEGLQFAHGAGRDYLGPLLIGLAIVGALIWALRVRIRLPLDERAYQRPREHPTTYKDSADRPFSPGVCGAHAAPKYPRH